MHKALIITALLMTAANPSLATADVAVPVVTTQIPDDLHLLVGKHVVVGRMPLCVPSTYTVNLSYAGKLASVLAFKENNSFDHLGAGLNRLPPNMRAMMEDAKKGGVLEFQFEDGTKLDTCGNLLLTQLSPNLTLAAGERITLPAAALGALAAMQAPPTPIPPGGLVHPQLCPVVITKVTSGAGLGHALIDALTTSEFERQLDETAHEGQGKHYLDVAVRNSSDKPIVAFEFAAVYSDKMGDETTSATYVSQNEHAIQPGDISKASAMDRNEWSQNGAGQVTMYISRVRFNDKTMWKDDGTHSCSREIAAK
jgi:hypothetical protein